MRWVSTVTAAAIGAGALAGPAAAATPSAAAASGPEVRCTSTDRALAGKLSHDISRALAGRKSMASVSFYDRPTGTSCTLGASRQYDSASAVKAVILGALLYQKGGTLTAGEDALARKMITESDNDSATALWKELSDLRDPEKPDPVGIQEFLDKARMGNTVLDKEGSWGLTQVTAGDLARLLRLFSGSDDSVLGSGARTYALDLMQHVRPAQRWGATAGAPLDSLVHVKNGWLQRSRNSDVDAFDRGDWKVNSLAVLTGNAYDSGLVVLTENNRVPEGRPAEEGWNYGIDTIEAVSHAVYRDVYPGAERYEPGRSLRGGAETAR
ncbi:hypothetical protein ACFW81_12375 [Streptomyces angustmyceticus]|uniref:hypothetical protein n=1 Tax=Streptomyces angustmyceticus TaxID=285578 RepID=UPI00369C3223